LAKEEETSGRKMNARKLEKKKVEENKQEEEREDIRSFDCEPGLQLHKLV
jgi:hypothetical protein